MIIVPKVVELNKAIALKGVSKKSFAFETGVSELTIIRACKGKTVRVPTSKKICDALKIGFDEIFEIVQKNEGK